MNSSLDVQVALSHLSVPSTRYMEGPLYALLDLHPTTVSNEAAHVPLNLVFVIDSSATMHDFQLTEEEHGYWLGLAISRDEMERGEADERKAVYWSGQTLAEMQSVARKPMTLVVEAIKGMLSTLQQTDKIAVIAFADRVHAVFNEQDWAFFPDQCLTQMDALWEQRLPVDIGTGTFMADALRLASQYLSQNTASFGINRLIIISDGIVQDQSATLEAISEIKDHGYSITTVGVGEEFDEEFLTRVADESRGDYHYAADVAEIMQCLNQEMTTLQTTTVTDLYVAARGLEGAVVQEIALVRPAMNLFDEIYTEDDWMRARVGDISSAAPTSILLQVAPPMLEEGDHPLVEIQLTWAGAGDAAGSHPGHDRVLITSHFTDNPAALAEANQDVLDLVNRFSIYKFEREAQRAQEKGDLDRAKEKLGAATRELRRIGESGLAADMESQIASLNGAVSDPTRVKRIKATTRRLGSATGTEATSAPSLTKEKV